MTLIDTEAHLLRPQGIDVADSTVGSVGIRVVEQMQHVAGFRFPGKCLDKPPVSAEDSVSR